MKKLLVPAFILVSSLAGMKDARMTTERIIPSQPQVTVPEESPVDRSATTLHDPLMMLAAAAIAVAQDRTDPTPSTTKTTEPSTRPSLAALLLARQEELLHETPPRYSIECDICHNTFTTGKALERHAAQFHDESNPYDCNICHCRFVTNDVLKDHVETIHGNTHPHMCRFCYQGFSTLEDLEEHQRHDHASSAASVSEVQESTAHGAMDDALMTLATAAASIATDHTNASAELTSEPSSISCYRPLHARIERMDKSESTAPFDRSCKCSQDKKDFVCDVCHKKFATKPRLKRHVDSVHEGKKDFKCDKCAKTFSSKQNLKQHIASVHEGKKDFICNICHKNYPSKKNLKRHVNSVHEGKEDFKCNICHKNYSSQQYLRRHLETRHNPSLPHDCPLCHQRFATEKKLKNHLYHAHTSSASSSNAPIEFIDEPSSISCYRPLHAKVHQTDLSHNTTPFVRTFECSEIQSPKK